MKVNKEIINEFNKLIRQIKFDIDASKNKKEEITNSYRLLTIQKIIKILVNFPEKITSSDQLKEQMKFQKLENYLKLNRKYQINHI